MTPARGSSRRDGWVLRFVVERQGTPGLLSAVVPEHVGDELDAAGRVVRQFEPSIGTCLDRNEVRDGLSRDEVQVRRPGFAAATLLRRYHAPTTTEIVRLVAPVFVLAGATHTGGLSQRTPP